MIDIDKKSGAADYGVGSFFRKVDWASFWTSAILSFVVYFLTAAPSVTLEDAGELAVAGDHLGVPHPPGYPIWTLCAWVFARILGFVTFRGQPNPSWAIAVMSGFFGALATGLTAMLVTRTSSDILRTRESDEAGIDGVGGTEARGLLGKHDLLDIICWVSGVASSLVFAFSPVMWSQATIVEVYSLNAFFLMLIFVLTYRWMCRPTDRLLWITAFVFGLGLTNYQVILLAMIPLVIVILLQNIDLFRDFVLVVIPFGLTAGMMKLGALMSQPGFPKHKLINATSLTSSGVVDLGYYLGAILLTGAFVAAAAYGGWLAVRRASAKQKSDDSGLTQLALIATVVAALAMLMFCSYVPSAPTPSEFLGAPADKVFSWGMPIQIFLGATVILFVFALFTPAGLWYAVAITGIELVMAIFIRKGALLGLTHPLSGAFAFYVALNFIVLGLSWLLLPSGRTVSLTVLAAELGVAFYGYMPISSETNPPMNWGYPRTWEGFKHALTRGQYEKIAPTTMFSPLFVKQLGAYFADMRMQFTLILAPLGFLPFAVWNVKAGGRRFGVIKLAVAISGLVAILVAVDKVFAGVNLESYRIDKLLFAVLLLIAFTGAHAIVIGEIATLVRKTLDAGATKSARLVAGLASLGISLVILGVTLGFCNAAAEAMLEWMGRLEPLPGAPAAVHSKYMMADGALTFLLYSVWASGVALLTWVTWKRKRGFTLSIGEVSQRWHIATISGFLVMSLGLIALANPKYDIQDSFIQKVKFIASHGIFAIWIGYGLAYALTQFRRWKPLCAVLILAVMLTPILQVHENYRNERLVDTLGAAEQNGHDFGWQFGNYQLRGADAITEELAEEEEPLPNPEYPPAMTTNAVFYGGTDPGRFVPTYMIYSAEVRPDVFLITQNALADNTYMDTMRNLYSNDIWMPTIDDNSVAFQTYVEDVQAGRRPDMGGISMEGGRVQVNGALAVMEINGIITEKIFMKNRDRHDFYVEESYAIRWMYPYLTPHGLIMKINHDKADYTPRVVNNDMDFWDWYSRRLLSNPRYPRDFVARKSFSKLRGAIAGTYSNRRMMEPAERAFQEARALYVYSPEANLRLIQEVLIPQRRLDESVRMLELLQRLDPNNNKIPLPEIKQLQHATKRASELTMKIKMASPLDEGETLELAECSFTIGMPQQGMQALGSFMQSKGAKPGFAIKAGLLLAKNGQLGEASQIFASVPASSYSDTNLISAAELRKVYDAHRNAPNQQALLEFMRIYLLRVPEDWKAWLDYAMINIARGDTVKAARAMDFAVRHGGRDAEGVISQIPQLKTIYSGRGVVDPRINLPERQQIPRGK